MGADHCITFNQLRPVKSFDSNRLYMMKVSASFRNPGRLPSRTTPSSTISSSTFKYLAANRPSSGRCSSDLSPCRLVGVCDRTAHASASSPLIYVQTILIFKAFSLRLAISGHTKRIDLQRHSIFIGWIVRREGPTSQSKSESRNWLPLCPRRNTSSRGVDTDYSAHSLKASMCL